MQNELMLTLWNYCNNRCVFCYNFNRYQFPIDIKGHLIFCNDFLRSKTVENFDTIRLLGGELFDGIIHHLNIEKEFFSILESIHALLENQIINKVNFVTNLLYDDLSDLEKALSYFDLDQVTLSTSYDMFGRFSKESEQQWWKNLNHLQNKYKELRIDVGMIMTQPFIKIVTKEWLDDFIKRLNKCTLNLNELYTDTDKKSLPELFPKRQDFILFLKKMKMWNYIGLIDKGSNASNLIHLVFTEHGFPVFKNVKSTIGYNGKNKKNGYIDSDILLTKDIDKILQMD